MTTVFHPLRSRYGVAPSTPFLSAVGLWVKVCGTPGSGFFRLDRVGTPVLTASNVLLCNQPFNA